MIFTLSCGKTISIFHCFAFRCHFYYQNNILFDVVLWCGNAALENKFVFYAYIYFHFTFAPAAIVLISTLWHQSRLKNRIIFPLNKHKCLSTRLITWLMEKCNQVIRGHTHSLTMPYQIYIHMSSHLIIIINLCSFLFIFFIIYVYFFITHADTCHSIHTIDFSFQFNVNFSFQFMLWHW